MNAPHARVPKRSKPTARAAVSSTPARESEPEPILTYHRALVTPEQRQSMVADAAYYYAERRGFSPGYELNDWLAAEDQIDATLTLGDTPTPCGS